MTSFSLNKTSNTNSENENKLHFQYLPDFAQFILETHLEDYIRMAIQFSREENVPILKLFSDYTDNQLVELGRDTHRNFLLALANNQIKSYIESLLNNYISNTMPKLDQNDVMAEDITVGAFLRRKTFRFLLPGYTSDPFLLNSIIDEVDRLTTWTELISYEAYIDIQKNKLKSINSELTQTLDELQNKTTQLESLNASLESKNSELESINKELASFNYIASHDLQEPLRKIQIFANRIIENGTQDFPDETLSYFDKIIAASSRMQELIDDLLTFSQTTANNDKFAHTDLNSILEDVKIILSPAIDEKKVIIETTHLPELYVIPFQIQQLFLNLINNSIKYSREGIIPHIRITSAIIKTEKIIGAVNLPAKKYIEISIEDNGIGFKQEYSEKIFGLFQRLHNREKYSGTGLGLAICKKIVNNHNGFIIAKGSPQNGSVFYVYLPIAKTETYSVHLSI
ncbi:MAG: ATP-binding protein [Bacteroidota bacterium]|nr:ATP-binding protein [Bacteroidota bacterium]